MTSPAPEAPAISSARKWAITVTVMVVAFMQILDTSVTNVILPHLQGSMSAGLDEVSWVITSYLAANAVVIPATGWLAGLFGRKRFFLICSTLFVASSFLSGIAPNLTTLLAARICQGVGGGPIIPLSQAILWEIFPFHQRGLAMAIWGVGFILGPILGPTVGGYLADEWSWRWIFYINLPVGIIGFFMASAFLFDPPYLRRAARIDWWGLVLMVVGFACLQLVLDRGEREEWFDSPTIVAMTIVAVCALAGFLIRELMTSDPIVDLTAFSDRNFATGVTLISVVGFGMFSGMLLVAVFTQQLLGYDAWTSGLVLAPGGPLRDPGQRYLHCRPSGDGDALSRDGLAGAAAGVCGRLLAAGDDVRGGAADPAVHAPHPARADVSGDGRLDGAGRARGGGRRRLSHALRDERLKAAGAMARCR